MEFWSDFWVQSWFSTALFELQDYFRHLTKTQWGIVSAGSFLFGSSACGASRFATSRIQVLRATPTEGSQNLQLTDARTCVH